MSQFDYSVVVIRDMDKLIWIHRDTITRNTLLPNGVRAGDFALTQLRKCRTQRRKKFLDCDTKNLCKADCVKRKKQQ